MAQLSDAELRRRVGADGDALAHLLPNAASRWGGRAPTDVLDAVERAHRHVRGGARLPGAGGREAADAARDRGPPLGERDDPHGDPVPGAAGRPRPLLIVVTTRDSAPDLDDRLAEFLSDLGRSPSVETVRLAGLGTADVAELLIGLGSERDPEQATIDAGGQPPLRP